MEGFRATGGYGVAQKLGEIEAETWEDACYQLLQNDPMYDPEENAVWGCALFPSEYEARKSFG